VFVQCRVGRDIDLYTSSVLRPISQSVSGFTQDLCMHVVLQLHLDRDIVLSVYAHHVLDGTSKLSACAGTHCAVCLLWFALCSDPQLAKKILVILLVEKENYL
jgi:hypothetical protein